MLTFALLNRKGGVGKTSLTIHLAGAYAAMGKRVLLLDLDPQASLTQGLLGPEAAENLPASSTVAAIFGEADGDPTRLPVPARIAGISIVPGSEQLDDVNVPTPTRAGPYQSAVRELLEAVAGGYDIALIDCPPTLYLCSWCALLVADHVVVPVKPDQYGTHSILSLQRMVGEACGRNPKLSVLGYVLNQLQPRLALHQLYEQALRELYGALVLTNAVPLLADYGVAAASGQPIETCKPRSRAAKIIRSIAEELWLRAWMQAEAEWAAA